MRIKLFLLLFYLINLKITLAKNFENNLEEGFLEIKVLSKVEVLEVYINEEDLMIEK